MRIRIWRRTRGEDAARLGGKCSSCLGPFYSDSSLSQVACGKRSGEGMAWSLSLKLAAWGGVVLVLGFATSVALGSGAAPADEAARENERAELARGLASAASAGLYLVSLLHVDGKGERAKPFAIAGGSASVVAAITYAGLALSSSDREEAAVRGMSAGLFGTVAALSVIAAMVSVIRAMQTAIHDLHDPSGERAEAVMRQRERVESILSIASECLLSAAVILLCVALVAVYRRPSLHVAPTDMMGKMVIVTDSCKGRGFAHAETLARWKAEVIVACDDEEEARRSAEAIVRSSGNPRIHGMLLDLRSIQSVRTFAKSFSDAHRHLHVLVNSADAPVSKATSGPALLTPDGVDSVLQVL